MFELVKSENPYYQEVMLYYRTQPCPNQSTKQPFIQFDSKKGCTLPSCFNFHTQDERRRPVFHPKNNTIVYLQFLCPAVTNTGNCPDGDVCKFCHNQSELDYHPNNYKTEECLGCTFEAQQTLCPRFHTDEASRKDIISRFQSKQSKPTTNKVESLNNSTQAFDLEHFKTQLCQSKGSHNPKFCYYYHHENDRRRDLNVFQYEADLCPKAAHGQPCPDGDDCPLANNKVEQLYHVDRYKKKFCSYHPNKIDKCEYGKLCSFAHGEHEIKIQLLHNLKQDENFYLYHYKTVFCPYIYEHDRGQCVYAHNPQDFRRNLTQYKYEPVQCPNWATGQLFTYADGKCPKMMDCDKCHGWKEMEFHPSYFRTRPCTNKQQCQKRDCPFYHNNTEKRQGKLNGGSLNTFSASFQPPYSTPTKSSNQFKVEVDDRFYSEPLAKKSMRVKNSHFTGPVYAKKNFQEGEIINKDTNIRYEKKDKNKKKDSQSTRPNSGTSSTSYSEDDRASNRKNERKSVDVKKERVESPQSTNSDKTGSKSSKTNKKLQNNNHYFYMAPSQPLPIKLNWDTQLNSNHDIFKRKDSSDSNSDFFDVFRRQDEEYLNPKDENFKRTLTCKLEQKDLSYVIPIILAPGTDIEALKTFNKQSYVKYPGIKETDKEKIEEIIAEMQDSESFLLDLNSKVFERYSLPVDLINDQQDFPRNSMDSNFEDVLIIGRKLSGI